MSREHANRFMPIMDLRDGEEAWNVLACPLCGSPMDYRARSCRACFLLKWQEKACPGCRRMLGRDQYYFRANGSVVSRCKECTAAEGKAKDKSKRAVYAKRARNYKATSARLIFRHRTDIQFKLKRKIQNGILKALKKRGATRASRSVSLLGCSIQDFILHIERQWRPGMTWDNFGSTADCWQLDHIKPVSSFDLTISEQQFACFSHTNIQPLWMLENAKKGARLDWVPAEIAADQIAFIAHGRKFLQHDEVAA